MTDAVGSRRWPWFFLAAVLVVAGGAIAFRQFGPTAQDTPPSPRPPEAPPDIVERVHTFCGSGCHAYPPPDTFPRGVWRAEVERGFRFFENSGMSLRPPPIESVVRYYEERAPEELPAAQWPPPSRPHGVRFERRGFPGPAVPERFAISNVNLVRLPPPGTPSDSGPLDVLACDMRNGLVILLRPSEASPAWKVLGRVPHPAHAEVVDLDADGLLDVLVADLGTFEPKDRRCGSVVLLRGQRDGSFASVTLLDNVGRVADVQAADFRGTGKLDLVVGVFGWQTVGEMLYLENQTTDWQKPRFVPRVLDERHGAIHVPVADLNDDRRPDFVALFGQEHESVVAFVNEGAGNFRKQTLYAAPHPGWGSSGIQLVDFDGDGRLDVLASNGDILDEPYLFKPYHGVQWLRNQGGLKFEPRPLTPMYGVHRAVAGDVLGRGRKDVIAVSFLPEEKFPERVNRRVDAIVLLEQGDNGKFERHTLASVDCDHVTCAVGDVFGTGRLDIVVGHFSAPSTDQPVTIFKNLGGR